MISPGGPLSAPNSTQAMVVSRGSSGRISDHEPSSPAGHDAASSSSPGDVCAQAVENGGEEMDDPQLWSQLPGHNLMDVFSRLPLLQIFGLPVLSKEWSRITKERTFRRLRAEAHPEVLCVVGQNYAGEVTFAALDKHRFSGRWSSNWCYRVLHGILYDDILFAHDGGLVSLVNCRDGALLENLISVRVCNPLTDEWKILPAIPESTGKEPVLLQMEVDGIRRSYRVDVVIQETAPLDAAETIQPEVKSYDSGTGEWRTITSGAVYGMVAEPDSSIRKPVVFKVSTGRQFKEFQTEVYTPLGPDSYPHMEKWPVLVKDHVHVLVEKYASDQESADYPFDSYYLKFHLAYDVSVDRFRHVVPPLTFKTGIPRFSDAGFADYGVRLFACHGYTMVVVFYYSLRSEDSTWVRKVLQTRLFDGSTGEWIYLPLLNLGSTYQRSRNSFMCKLMWDISP